MDIRELVAQNGAWFYLIIFAWTFLEGETIVLFAGVAAAQGLLDPWLLFFTAWVGSYCGDQTYFFLGRRFGTQLLDRFPRWRGGVDLSLRWLERYDAGFILSFRFIYGVRNFASFAMGLSAVRWERFLKLNLVAALLWASSFVSVGYFLGQALRAVLGDVVRTFGYTMLGVFVALALGIKIVHALQRRRQNRVPAGAKPIVPPP
jgi:membrane protein DedA with SNARE-associated domain